MSQVQEGKERVIAYGSKVLSKAERNYCVTRRELLAVVTYLKHYKQYLYGRHVKVRTDHGALRWLTNFKLPEGQLARWLEVIAAYDIEIIHRAGRSHGNADALSRRPCRQCGRELDCNTSEEEKGQARAILMTDDRRISEMRRAQLDDPNIKPVLEALERNTKPTKEEVSAMSKKVKVLLEHWGQLQIRNGILYRKWESVDGKEVKWRLVLPRGKTKEVLEELHAGSLAGHLGATKTLKSVQMRYYWVGMKEDVRSFIRKCEACARRKSTGKKRRAPLQQRRSGSPMERIALDILGPLPETNDGNKYIMVVGDYYTKFVEAYPIPDEKASTVAPKLVEEFMCRYGVPREIHTDQGRNFESQLFKEVCQILGIKKTRTTPYNPKSDGMIERFNRTLLDMLVTLIDPGKNQRDWDKHVPLATAAYRSAVHETTQETPNMVMFGRELKMPSDHYAIQSETEVGTDYVEKLRERMDDIYSRINEHTQKNLRRQKKNYDKKMAGNSYEEGNYVWLRNDLRHKGVSPKLSYRWDGPYKIKTKLSDVTYRIQRSPRAKMRIVHFDRLKPYVGDEPEEWKTTHKSEDVEIRDTQNERKENLHEDVGNPSSPEDGKEQDVRRYPLRRRKPPVFFY